MHMTKNATALAAGVMCVGLVGPGLSAQAPAAAPVPNPKVPAIVVSAPAVQVVNPPAYADPKSDLSPVTRIFHTSILSEGLSMP